MSASTPPTRSRRTSAPSMRSPPPPRRTCSASRGSARSSPGTWPRGSRRARDARSSSTSAPPGSIPSASAGGGGPWSGQTWVITGSLDGMSRTDAEARIRALGGNPDLERQSQDPHGRGRRVAGEQAGEGAAARTSGCSTRPQFVAELDGGRGISLSSDTVTTMAAPRRAERLLDDKAQLRARLRASPDGPGVYVMRGPTRGSSTSARPPTCATGCARGSAGIDALQPRTHQLIVERLRLRGDRVPERARGAGAREHAHQAAPAAIQRAPQGRQELSLPQDSAPRRARRGRAGHGARGGAQAARARAPRARPCSRGRTTRAR